MDYTIAIKTGDKPRAGTNARVFLTLFGTTGQTGEIHLNHPNYNDFVRGKLDTFNMTLSDIGDPKKVRLRHDNTRKGAGWYLESIDVVRQADHKRWSKKCNIWLATSRGDGKIDRMFTLTKRDFTLVYHTSSAKVGQVSGFYLDPGVTMIWVKLYYGALSALIARGSETQSFGQGQFTLNEPGWYEFTVGSWSSSNYEPYVTITYLQEI